MENQQNKKEDIKDAIVIWSVFAAFVIVIGLSAYFMLR